MAPNSCKHPDVRELGGTRSCLACGEAWFRSGLDKAEPYVYTDLRCLEVGQRIRIVVIEPGEASDPLRCTLELSDLRSTNYHAISYTWASEDGDAAKSQSISVDGRSLYVTKNCDAALRRMRRVGPHSRIWIDAICINQLSITERNHQVGLMDKIYRSALRVHVCIDDHDSNYRDLMCWLHCDEAGRMIPETILQQASLLFRHQYFYRVWVIQEVALAKVITLHVNNEYLDLSQRVLSSLFRIPCTKPRLLLMRRQCRTTQPLHQRLKDSMSAFCADPRDKVFAIHSLLEPSVRELITIDYSLSVEQVYINAFSACLATTGQLDLLLAARLEKLGLAAESSSLSIEHFERHLTDATPPRGEVQMPPSWNSHVIVQNSEGETINPLDVPISDGKTINPLAWPALQGSSTVRILPGAIPLGQVLPRLRIRAYPVEHLVHTASLPSGSSFSYEYEPRVGRIVIGQSDFTKPRSIVRTSELRDIRFAPNLDKPFVQGVVSWLLEVRKSLDLLKQGAGRIFSTQHGMGICCARVQPGDRMYVLDGVKHCFVLRPMSMDCDEDGHRSGEKYRQYRIVCASWWQSLLEPLPVALRGHFNHVESVRSNRPNILPTSEPEPIEIY